MTLPRTFSVPSSVSPEFSALLGTPLWVAARRGHVEAVEALLTSPGIDINAEGPDWSTPLGTALAYSHVDTVRALVAAGARQTTVNGWGQVWRP